MASSTRTQWSSGLILMTGDERVEYIKEMVLASDAFLVGRITYEMLAGY